MSMVEVGHQHADAPEAAGLTLSEKTLLSLQAAYRHTTTTVSSVLGVKRIKFMLTGTRTLDEPLVMLGARYEKPVESSRADSQDGAGPASSEVQDALRNFQQDLEARPWFCYRTGFPPLGRDELSSDVGWGCTLRSCQMMLAQALLMHRFGAHAARRPGDAAAVQRVLAAFHDAPSPASPFSIHAICRAGAPYGLVPGRWMGPYAICRALSDIGADAAAPHLSILTLDSGGGAPCVDPDMLEARFADAAPQHAHAAAAALFPPDALPVARGVLLLLPVVLGVERLNSVYAEQLAAVLSWPHCAGIVGGKPGHSYYFVGHQAGRLLGLDPHSLRPADATPGDAASHICADLLSVPTTAIDSTMALAFVCGSAQDARDLCGRMRALSEAYRAFPLVSVGAVPAPPGDGVVASWEDDSEDDGVSAADEAEPGVKGEEVDVPEAASASPRDGAQLVAAAPAHTPAGQGAEEEARRRECREGSDAEGECAAERAADAAAAAAPAQPRAIESSEARECSGSWHRRVLSVCDSDSSVGGSLVAVTPAGSAPSHALHAPTPLHAPRTPSALGREGSLGPGAGWELIEGASPECKPREGSGPLLPAQAFAGSASVSASEGGAAGEALGMQLQ